MTAGQPLATAGDVLDIRWGLLTGLGMMSGLLDPLASFVPMMATACAALHLARVPWPEAPASRSACAPLAASGSSFRDVSALVDGPRARRPARERLQGMSSARRRMFDDLWSFYDGKRIRFPASRLQASVTRELGDLLESGQLDVTDSRGVDLLTNLHALHTQPHAAGIDGPTVTAQAIVEVGSPARTMTQGDHGTCAAASVQYLLARRNPSELVRVAAGLVGSEGRVALADGRVARRVADSVAEDHSGRSALDRIMQASFMDAAAAGSTPGTYSNARDAFLVSVPRTFEPPPSWRGFMSPFGTPPHDLVVQDGLRPEQTQRLAESALGVPYQEIYREGWGSPSRALDRMALLLADGAEPLPVSMRWEGGSHRVVVTEIKDGRVHFRNPWGERQKHDRRGSLWGVDHRVGQGGLESIPVHEFEARMKSVIAPTHLLQGGPRA